jgi:hypothetical protein
MIFQVLPSVGMHEDREIAAVERQPRQQWRQLFVLERYLVAEARVRADRPLVEAAHLDRERLLDLLTQRLGGLGRDGIEVDMGVPVLDFRCVHALTLSYRSTRLTEPSAVPRCEHAC